jgi:hypothetical protein
MNWAVKVEVKEQEQDATRSKKSWRLYLQIGRW